MKYIQRSLTRGDMKGRKPSEQLQSRNALLPIFKLPNELLVDIFGLTDAGALNNVHLHLLARVCKQRSRIVLFTPYLWRTLDYHNDTRMNALVLKKNAVGPLDVRVHYWDRIAHREAPLNLGRFLSDCVRQAHRWHTAYITIRDPEWEHYIPYLQEGLINAICLKALTLETSWPNPMIQLVNSSHLQRLAIHGPHISSGAWHLMNLRRLQFAPNGIKEALGLLPTLLQAASFFQELELNGAYLQFDDETWAQGSFDSSGFIYMNNLRALLFGLCRAPFTRAILGRLVAPVLELLVVEEVDPEAFNSSISPVCHDTMAGIFHKAARTIVVSDRIGEITLTSDAPPPIDKAPTAFLRASHLPERGFQIKVRKLVRSNWCHVLSFLQQLTDSAIHIKLMVHGSNMGGVPNSHSPTAVNEEEIIRSIIWAQKVELCGPPHGIKGVLDMLVANDDGSGWNLPRLQELDVHLHEYFDWVQHEIIVHALIRVVQVRGPSVWLHKLLIHNAGLAEALRESKVMNEIMSEDSDDCLWHPFLRSNTMRDAVAEPTVLVPITASSQRGLSRVFKHFRSPIP